MAAENEKETAILEEIKIEGYRSCLKTSFKPNPTLSALIGINGAGKTNTLNALNLLALPLPSRWRSSQEILSPAETRITALFVINGRRVGLRLHLTFSTTSRGNDEILGYKEEWSFPFEPSLRTWMEIPPFILPDENTKQRHLFEFEVEKYFEFSPKNSRGGSSKYSEIKRKWNLLSSSEVTKSIQAINEFRRGIRYYSASQFTNPTHCPSNFEVDSDLRLERTHRLSTSSSHLAFLYDLYRLKNSNNELYKEYEGFVSRQQLGLISRLTWKEIKLSSNTVEVKTGGKITKVKQFKTLVIPKIQIGTSHITFNQLSEGTFKTLAIIFYIMTDTSTCLLIEEPEVCVHHGLLTKIVNTIEAYSNSKQVIFSTHSDQVLDTLSHENVFVVQMIKSETHVSKLANWVGNKGLSALKAYLEETGTLGEYWKSGGFSS